MPRAGEMGVRKAFDRRVRIAVTRCPLVAIPDDVAGIGIGAELNHPERCDRAGIGVASPPVPIITSTWSKAACAHTVVAATAAIRTGNLSRRVMVTVHMSIPARAAEGCAFRLPGDDAQFGKAAALDGRACEAAAHVCMVAQLDDIGDRKA